MAEVPIPVQFTAAEITARGTKPFRFRIMVPDHWVVARASDKRLSAKAVELIAMFVDPVDPLTNVSVLGQILTAEISAADWLHHFLTTRENANYGGVAAAGARRARATFDTRIDGARMVGLTTVTVNGDTTIVLQAMCPEQKFDAVKDALNAGVRSFNTEEVVTPNVVEPWLTHRLSPAVSFEFPASWQVQAPPAFPSGRFVFDLLRKDSDQVVQGFARVKSIEDGSVVSLDEALRTTIKEFEASNLRLSMLPAFTSIDPWQPFVEAKSLDVPASSNPTSVLQFQSTAVRTRNVTLVVTCLGPESGQDYYQWAVNCRAYEIAIGTLRV